MAIIDGQGLLRYAESIELSQQVSIAQVKSQSGRRSAQRRGPVLYNLTVVLGVASLHSEKYYAIQEEIISLNYGENTLRFKFEKGTSEERHLTSPRGNWSGDPKVRTPDLTGTSLEIMAAQANDLSFAKTGDYLQVSGSTKVYQVAPTFTSTPAAGKSAVHNYISNSSGNLNINLNTPLVNPPDPASAIVFGNDVAFHMMLREKPKVTYLAGDIVEFGSVTFEEVIENTI